MSLMTPPGASILGEPDSTNELFPGFQSAEREARRLQRGGCHSRKVLASPQLEQWVTKLGVMDNYERLKPDEEVRIDDMALDRREELH